MNVIIRCVGTLMVNFLNVMQQQVNFLCGCLTLLQIFCDPVLILWVCVSFYYLCSAAAAVAQ